MSLSPVTPTHGSCSFSWLLFYHGRLWLKTGPKRGLFLVFPRNFLQGIPLVRRKYEAVYLLSHTKISRSDKSLKPITCLTALCQSGLQFAMRRSTDNTAQSTDAFE